MKKYILFILMIFTMKCIVTAQEKEMIIDGYLFKDSQNRISLGMPIVAMSTIGGYNYYFDESFADKFKPLINGVENSKSIFFYNYEWLNKEAKTDVSKVPKILLMLKAKVKVIREDGDRGCNIYQIKDAKLMHVEWISDEWLVKWKEVYQMMDLKYGRGEISKAFDKKEAEHLCDLLNQMHALKPSKEQIEIVKKIDPDAKLNAELQRNWEETYSKKVSEILDKLEIKPRPKLPRFIPSNVDLSEIIMKAKSRKEFLRNIIKDYGEEALDKSIWVYVRKESGSVSSEEVNLLKIKDWTDKQFEELQKSITKP